MNNPRGFTLLELLLATMLSTLLMVGVLAVITDLGSPAMASANVQTSMATLEMGEMDAWLLLLREDLNHADQIDVSNENQLTLIGYSALDAQRRERTHRPVHVLYKLEEIDGRLWLVRRQSALDVVTNQNVQRDLVCSGVTRFEVVSEGEALDSRVVDLSRSPMVQAPQGITGVVGTESESNDDPPTPRITHDYRVDHKIGYIDYAFVDDPPPTEENKPKTLSSSQGMAQSGDTALTDADKQRAGGVIWRLRVWTDNQSQPAQDRVVTIHTDGGA